MIICNGLKQLLQVFQQGPPTQYIVILVILLHIKLGLQ